MFFPTPDRVGQLAAGQLLQPLNHTYVPNLANVWDSLQDPFYDKGSVYTVPYTIYTTGIGYRIDAVSKVPDDYENPYDIFWDAANAGQVYLLEDDREVFGMAMIRGTTPSADVNTEEAGARRRGAGRRVRAHRPRQRQDRRRGLHRPAREAGLGRTSAGRAMRSTPSTTCPRASRSNIGYWYPPDGGGIVGSDAIAVLRSATKPVLAHAFLNYLLDETHALENYSWLGYQPPQTSLDPDRVVADGYVPAHLATAVVRPEDFETGQQLLQLSLAGSGGGTTPGRRSRRAADHRPPASRTARRLWPALAAPGVLWLVALFLVPFYGVLAVAFGRCRPDLRQRRAGVEPRCGGASTPSATSSSGSSRPSSATVFVRTVRVRRCGPADLLPHRLPGRLLRGPLRRAPPWAAAGAAAGAVLDQLPDAHAGAGSTCCRTTATSTTSRRLSGSAASTGSTGGRSRS